MTETPTTDTSPAVPSRTIDWNMVARWGAAVGIGGAVLALELTGHADKGTFIQMVAGPALVALGVHTAAKNLN